MKKTLLYSAVGITLIVLVILLSQFNSNPETGKYDTLEEALRKGVPYQIKDVIHTDKVNEMTIVMYITEPDKEEFPLANFNALAVAFFNGNNQEGWDHVGPNGWDHTENDNMTVYFEYHRDHDREGNLKNDIFVVYGEINNPIIDTVETRGHNEANFNTAKIINKNGKRYYYTTGRELIVRGLTKDGEIIDQQGG